MIVLRRRLFLWLIKAYIKKWGKAIGLFFVLGLILFFTFAKLAYVLVPKIPFGHKETIGMVGAYTVDTIPSPILAQLSHGLTALGADGKPVADIAKSWTVQDSGKTYIFHLKPDIYYSDGTNVTTDSLQLSFADVSIQKPDKYTLVFKLQDSYSPFLVTVSRPLFKSGFVGTGDYAIRNVKINGNFIESMTLQSKSRAYDIKLYHFYPSQEALKIAYTLGEVSRVIGLPDANFKNASFYTYKNTKVEKQIDYVHLVTIFFNMQDPVVSDEKVRSALSYSLPDSFTQGIRNYTPYPPQLWVDVGGAYDKKQDLDHAKLLLSTAGSLKDSDKTVLTITTLSRYQKTAEEVSAAWAKIGVKSKITIVDSVPSNFQIFLGDFRVPKDPDQYMLWHKDQANNITRYHNLRIDKLLEDGRKVTDINERKKIYSDFQKYLLADSPAAFLFFPYEYNLTRK